MHTIPRMKIGFLAAPNENGQPHPETIRYVQEIERAGHTPQVIDYTTLTIGLGDDGLYTLRRHGCPLPRPDIVIPYYDTDIYAGELALTALMHQGIPSTAQPEKIHQARDKFLAQMAFAKHEIAHPLSIAAPAILPKDAEELHGVIDHVEPDHDKDVIVKSTFGTHGEQVWKKNRVSAIAKAYELAVRKEGFMFQRFIPKRPGQERASDIGVFVCYGVVLATFQRIAKEGEYRANISQAGAGIKHLTPEHVQQMGLDMSAAVGVEIGRADIMDASQSLDPEAPIEPEAIEYNTFPQLGIEEITGINVVEKIIANVVSRTEEYKADLETYLEKA